MGGLTTCPQCGATAGESLFCKECGVRLPESSAQDDPLVGRTIADKYLIHELLGSGAMGRIYRAEHSALERNVALKVLHPHLAYNESLVHRFLREARAASRLSHPNIVTLLDFGQDPGDGLLYLVMEFLEGGSLQSIIDHEGALDLRRAFDLAKQILLAVDEAHAHSIVHRDLKPENIIVLPTRRGEQVKVVDFGLAQLVGTDDPRLTSTGLVCGTPSYISPEQARSSDVGPLTDIYSFGVMLYEMVTGLLPFEATGAYEMVSKHLTEEPPPPQVRAPHLEIPHGLSEVILRCLEKSPENRMASAAEVHDALLRLERTLTTGDRPMMQASKGEISPVARPDPGVGQSPGHTMTPWPQRHCPVCDRVMPDHARFCGSCGTDLTRIPADQPDVPLRATATDLDDHPTLPPRSSNLDQLQQVMPQGLLEAMLHAQPLLRSPRRQITVLFAALSAPRETTPELMSRGFDLLMQTVRQQQGTGSRGVGDSVMAVFGVPVYHEDDSLRAVRAALAMRDGIRSLTSDPLAHLDLRAGIQCGTVVTGPAGGASLDLGAVSHTVRQAQRLASATDGNTVVIGEAVRQAAGTSFELRDLPTVDLDAEILSAYAVEREPLATAPQPIALPSAFLVGRAGECTMLEEAARHAALGQGSAVLMVGEAGIGKSALLAHLAQTLPLLGITPHLIRPRSSEGGHAGVFGQLLRSLLDCPIDATDGQVQGRLDTTEGLDDTDRAALAFLALSSRSSASIPALALDLTCLTAMRRLIRLVAKQSPVGVLLDDLRAVGGRERQLLLALTRALQGERLLLVAADRKRVPEFEEAGMKLLEVGPLHPADAERLLRQLAGDRPVDAETVQRVQESSGGSPLYLVETARFLDREGYLSTNTPRRQRLRAITVPTNIQSLVTSRFDNLDPLAKEALVNAAVVGRPFTLSLLSRMLPDARGLPLTLDELEENGLLERNVGASTTRLRFRHELVREILWNSLTHERRRSMHERLASILLDGADPDTPAGEIGRHLERAGHYTDAANQFELAATEHEERGEPDAAARYFALALEARERVETTEDPAQLIDLRIRLARAHNRAGQWDQAREVALGARNQALPTGDVVLAARASHELARAAAEQGDLPLADSVLREAYHTALECAELDLAAELASTLGEVQERTGHLEQALQTLEGAFQRLDAAVRRTRTSQTGTAAARVAEVLNRLGRVMIRMDRAKDALGYLQTALKHARVAADPMLEGRVLGNLGRAQSMTGDQAAAMITLDEALKKLQRAGDRVGTAKLLHNLAHLHLESGQRDQAHALARESLDLSVEIGWHEGETMSAAFLDRLQ